MSIFACILIGIAGGFILFKCRKYIYKLYDLLGVGSIDLHGKCTCWYCNQRARENAILLDLIQKETF